MDILDLIRVAKARNASDLHLAIGSPAMLRVHGEIVPAIEDSQNLTTEDMKEAFNQLTNDREKKEFYDNLELDFAYFVPDLTRVRCNAAMQKGSISLVLRLISKETSVFVGTTLTIHFLQSCPLMDL